MAKRSYRGSCHCGAVKFEIDADLAAGTSKCNCSICTKHRFWKTIVKPEALRLIQGAGALSEYTFGGGAIRHMFCRTCGVKPFGRGEMPELGVFYGVNIACLDDATDAELAASPVKYENGRENDWDHAPAETRYL
jgi:hypothetical protein